MTMISMVLGMVYFILIPPSRLNLAYFISGICQTFSGVIMVMAYQFPQYAKPIFLFGIIIFGASRAAVSCPYLLLIQFYNSPKDVVYVNVWFGLIELGIGWGYMLETWFLEYLKLHWTVSLMILFLIFQAAITLVYIFVP